MKLRDMIEAERYFSNDRKKEKLYRKKETTLKDVQKFIKQVEEFKRFEKEAFKKEERKEHKGLLPHDWSIAKKTVFFAILGPPLGIGYVFGLVIMIRLLAGFVVGVR